MGQSLTRLLTHITFSTKNRQRFITPDIRDELHRYVCGVFRNLKSPVIEIGSVEDHIHILCNLSRNVALAKLLEKAKANSSRWAKTKGTHFRSFAWQDGYAAFSIGQSGAPALTRYIARQAAHHRKVSYQDELRAFFKRYRMEYDERYVWE
ncbi:MAG: IS200/IS605 family transposase [Planctomycetota bacterium]|nr:IS200/IS605 family transposase [Planctomycetota bacterium]